MERNWNWLPIEFVYVPEKKTKTVPVNLSYVGIEIWWAPDITSKRINTATWWLKERIFAKLVKTPTNKDWFEVPTHPVRIKWEVPMWI